MTEEISVSAGHATRQITCSVGVCVSDGKLLNEIFTKADIALHFAKENGKSCCVQWGEPCELLTRKEDAALRAPGAQRYCVLIADDDKYSLRMLQKALEKDYRVLTAADGEQALALMNAQEIALLITDIQMPKLSGWDVLEAMQQKEALKDVPVIVITSDDQSESEIKALNLGATDVIVKPFVKTILLSRVQNTIARREARVMEEQNRLYELRIQQQEALLRMAELDELTGLLNRRAFVKRAETLIRRNPASTYVVSSLNIDG
ncbi:MAG: response regulator, partial [Oscillospiraceae bacterium]|nr:response regulator [Oscillospiraceae bacterium]